MGLIVQKFGGTSVGSVEKILNVVQRIKAESGSRKSGGGGCLSNGEINGSFGGVSERDFWSAK